MRIPPPFPAEKPAPYLRLDDEPPFIASRHLALEKPAAAVTLAELGYDESDIARRPSPLAITSAFRIFSDEGVAAANSLAEKMKSNRNESDATGKGRLGRLFAGRATARSLCATFANRPNCWIFFPKLPARVWQGIPSRRSPARLITPPKIFRAAWIRGMWIRFPLTP